MVHFQNNSDTIEFNTAVVENAGAFQKSCKVPQSPAHTTENLPTYSSSSKKWDTQGLQGGLGIQSPVYTPYNAAQGGQKPENSRFTELKNKVDELIQFVKDRRNEHAAIKSKLTSIKSSVNAAMNKQKAELAEQALKRVTEQASADKLRTPKVRGDKRKSKKKQRTRKRCTEIGRKQ